MYRPIVNDQGNYRKHIKSKRVDRRYFGRTGGSTHNLNVRPTPMRGGFRL